MYSTGNSTQYFITVYMGKKNWIRRACLCMYVYVYVCVCVCVCIYIYIYIYNRFTLLHTWNYQNIVLGWPIKFHLFLSKNKRYIFFHFHQEFYWTMYSPFCFTTFCHFWGNFIIPYSQKFWSFWIKKKLFQVPFSLPGNWIFFHKENFLKTEINGQLKMWYLVNALDE